MKKIIFLFIKLKKIILIIKLSYIGMINEKIVQVIGVFRHGDRTPKEKIKLKLKDKTLLRIF